MKRPVLRAACALLLSLGGARAETVETPLHAGGAWTAAEVTETATGQITCRATTTTAEGQVFSIVAIAGKAPFAHVFDPDLSVPHGPARLEIVIGARRFPVTGRSMTTSIGFPLAWGPGAWGPDFIAALAAGTRMHVETGAPQGPIVFDLAGSGAALHALFACAAALD